MTMKEIATMIGSIGLPFAYDHFTDEDTPGGPPFICFLFPNSDNFSADGIVYQKFKTLNIELYTNEKEPDYEEDVEDALDAAGLFYQSDETYLESEKMYMVRWETDVPLTKEED